MTKKPYRSRSDTVGPEQAATGTSRRDLGDDEAELHELGVDTRCTPTVLRHEPYESTNLGLDARSPGIEALRDLRPVSPESIPMPPDNCIGVDDDQAARPRGPRASQRDPEGPIDIVSSAGRGRSFLSAVTCCRERDFLSQGRLGADRSLGSRGRRERRGRREHEAWRRSFALFLCLVIIDPVGTNSRSKREGTMKRGSNA